MKFYILLLYISTADGAVGGSPNSKLKKNYRNTIEIIDKLLATSVTKEQHQEAIAAATANRNGFTPNNVQNLTRRFRIDFYMKT